VSWEILARALVERFEEVVPETSFATMGDRITFTGNSGAWAEVQLQLDDDERIAQVSDLESICTRVLSDLQDYVAEESGEPWPWTTAQSSGRRIPMPEPWASVREGELLLGFGDRDEPALALRPIPLSDIQT
jgi:hypothetical protein